MESRKSIFVSIAAAGILGATAAAWAQPGMEGMAGGPGGCAMGPTAQGGNAGMGSRGMMRSGMKHNPAARAEQHLAWLKSEIKPTAQQEPLWNAFAEKARAEAGKGMAALRDRAHAPALTAPERMARMDAIMKERLAAHEAVSDAFRRLYDSLTPEQKKAADQHFARMATRAERSGPPGAMSAQPMPQG